MTDHYAELLMYVAPEPVLQANALWLARIFEHLNLRRRDAGHLDLHGLWLAPELLVTQTCGYPLMTQLRGQVRVIGRPRYELAHSSGGEHCSLLLTRDDNPRTALPEFYNSRGVINGHDSNSGMNLLRERLAPLQRDGRFFASVGISGAHRESLRWLREGLADLAAIDSVTFDYLARFAPQEVAGLRVVTRSAPSPTLPYIGPLHLTDEQAASIRGAMNQALQDLPQVAQTLGVREVLPANEDDYHVLLGYQRQAADAGYPVLQ
ncbi:phosphate/phosphite/phosphonate ABC transporter substrate-binding protein [Pseudomonas tolaasii]|uniref:phosphate/phosphite/phosphonate ABC transporter substrate-binding protein n=1 Tax=Pseudomonas tolaasii TaxID=29442 RepID=UPI0003710F46|nr:PhnD/SsuA/transferrin family substrate-binding protein [Pseudomonas tolaasii]MBW1246842.1 PhnD/SsuA/transferrin family substrate-binding protein [Pseudomonas tolaasii]MBW4795467.1 PhnD/SsuA/transferrin family substrate-binding protein [Pseudomonas tolaasii]NWC27785.1 PhnD/SsuA/transferrin family substrate-binding protein [Pseudomonas tolaasii]NWC52214.1 PhnD/SsuA/transferrin family substrate-binding protein [Pseudomonas tolaasii]NWE65995.1 PhnD/SsuA/transferrin family substrate-binding prot